MSDDLRDVAPRGEAAVAGEWSMDPEFLVNADPERVSALPAAAPGRAARRAAAVYRTSAQLHHDAGPGVRQQLLALDAARYGDPELSAWITGLVRRGRSSNAVETVGKARSPVGTGQTNALPEGSGRATVLSQ